MSKPTRPRRPALVWPGWGQASSGRLSIVFVNPRSVLLGISSESEVLHEQGPVHSSLSPWARVDQKGPRPQVPQLHHELLIGFFPPACFPLPIHTAPFSPLLNSPSSCDPFFPAPSFLPPFEKSGPFKQWKSCNLSSGWQPAGRGTRRGHSRVLAERGSGAACASRALPGRPPPTSSPPARVPGLT